MEESSKCLLGPIIVETRKRLGFSQKHLSEKTGISERHLTMIEQGHVEPKLLTVIRLAQGLGVVPGDLLNEMAEKVGILPPHQTHSDNC